MANMAQDSIAQEDNLPVTSTLGLERWVQFAFIAGALALFWLFDHLIIVIWELFADSDGTLASAGAAILAIVISSALYKHPKVNKFSNEVAAELARVKWPTREETWKQTLIVLVVSVVAAIILGVFDITWSKLSDLVYQI
jgi:preprotein translocase subunit SecE